jgi:hypothetical protein
MMTRGRASRAGSAQDIINNERARTASAQGSHGGEPEEGEIVDIFQRGDSPRESPQSRRLNNDRRSDHLSWRNPSVTSSLIEEERRRQSKIVPGPSKGKEHAREMSASGDSCASTRTLHSSAQRELCRTVDQIADTLTSNQHDITAIHEAGAYTTKMATTAERAASNMGQQMEDLAAVVRLLQESAEHWELRRRWSGSQRESDSGEHTAPQNEGAQPSDQLSRREEAPPIERARGNRAPVTQEPHVMIEEETPQSDPKELERNIKLWKQWEAEASRKHMLSLKKMANRVERKLGQLHKEQWLQGELNVAVERNRQSHNTLSSYLRVRVAGLSRDTCHEQRGTPGAPQDSAPFWREQSMPLINPKRLIHSIVSLAWCKWQLCPARTQTLRSLCSPRLVSRWCILNHTQEVQISKSSRSL